MQPMGRRITVLTVFLLGTVASVEWSHGHALQPGYLEVRLDGNEQYAVLWKTPASGGRPMTIAAELSGAL